MIFVKTFESFDNGDEISEPLSNFDEYNGDEISEPLGNFDEYNGDEISEPLGIGQKKNKFEQFIEENGFIKKEITYRSHGMRLRRKGYDVINQNGHVVIEIEPQSYGKDSIYAKDKWKVCMKGRLCYVNRLTEIPEKYNKLKDKDY